MACPLSHSGHDVGKEETSFHRWRPSPLHPPKPWALWQTLILYLVNSRLCFLFLCFCENWEMNKNILSHLVGLITSADLEVLLDDCWWGCRLFSPSRMNLVLPEPPLGAKTWYARETWWGTKNHATLVWERTRDNVVQPLHCRRGSQGAERGRLDFGQANLSSCSCLYHLAPLCSWANYLTSLNLIFSSVKENNNVYLTRLLWGLNECL